jgi:Mn-containing catalase
MTETTIVTDLELIEKNKIHKIKFYEALEALKTEQDLTKKDNKPNKRLLTLAEYKNLIEEISVAYATKKTKTPRQYYLLNTQHMNLTIELINSKLNFFMCYC